MFRIARVVISIVPHAPRPFIAYWGVGAVASFALKKGITAVLQARCLNRKEVDERFEIVLG